MHGAAAASAAALRAMGNIFIIRSPPDSKTAQPAPSPQTGALTPCAAAVAGLIWAHRYKQTLSPKRMQGLDFGQPAAFESWVNRSAGHARVKYRDALWDAQVAGDASGEPGEILYITSVDGSTLKVSKTRPA